MVTVLPRLVSPSGTPLRVRPAVLSLVAGDHSGSACSMWRVWQPADMLQRLGYPAEWGYLSDPHTADFWQRFGLQVLCRVGWPLEERENALHWFDFVRRGGKRVLYEMDDDLVTPFMVQQQKAGREREKPKEEIEQSRQDTVWTIQHCDGVTVSTQYLASVLRQYTDKPVAVVPNMMDVDWFTAVQRLPEARRTIPGLTIGWAGGSRPDTDLQEMAIAWGRLADRYPQVTFVVMGHQPWVLSEHVPEHRLKRLPWLDPRAYPIGLANFDIGCCPLENRPFNRAKTPIKAWEYGVSGAAVVASPTVYRACIEHGRNGYLASTADEWEEHLAALVADPELRRYRADRLRRDVVEKWSLRENCWRWPAAWSELSGGGGTVEWE